MRRSLQILLPLIMLGSGSLGAFWLLKNRKVITPEIVAPFRPTVEVIPVKPEIYVPLIHSQGIVEPGRTIAFGPEVSGRIVSMSEKVFSGALVNKGQRLYEIDSSDYKLALKKAESEIASAKAAITNSFAQVESSEAQAIQAKAILFREKAEALAANQEWLLLGRKGDPPDLLVRKPQINEALAAIASAKAQASAATIRARTGEAVLKAAEAIKDQALLDIDRCVVAAPFDARISRISIDVGSSVASTTPALTLQKTDYCEIKVPLSSEDFELLGFRSEELKQAKPEVVLASGRHSWNGHLTRIYGDVDPQTQTLSVVARVNKPYDANKEPLRFGLLLKAAIKGAPLPNVYRIPETALRDNQQVFLYKQKKLSSLKVEVVRHERGQVYVLGLKEGQQVCVTQLDSFKESMEVILARESE